jgi:hypothetical protein
MAEDGNRADTGAVALFDALGEHAFHQVKVLAHRVSIVSDSAAQFIFK